MIMSNKIKGFSLLELLLALFVFSLLATFSYKAVNMLLINSTHLEGEANDIIGLQRTFDFLVRDLLTSVGGSDAAEAFSGEFKFEDGVEQIKLLSLTQRSEVGGLSGTAYQFLVESVIRVRANTGDMVLLNGVEHAKLDWFLFNDNSQRAGLRFTLTHEKFGNLQRVVFFDLTTSDLADIEGDKSFMPVAGGASVRN